MYISKTSFINWTRCPMYFPMDLKENPTGKTDIDERREEMKSELTVEMGTTEEDATHSTKSGPELEALLPFYNQVEDEALKVARKYFKGTFVADSRNVFNQKLFEYNFHGHTYRCYVDIYNENNDEINVIEVKAITNSKFNKLCFSYNKRKCSLFINKGNIWRFNEADGTINYESLKKFENKKKVLLNRYSDEGKYPYDLAFQRFVIENALKEAGDTRGVNYYLAVLNSKYYYDGATDASGSRVYNEIDGQELVTFYDMNETTASYQSAIFSDIKILEGYISSPHNIDEKCKVGEMCAWGERTECVFWKHCFHDLHKVPEYNPSNKFLRFGNFNNSGINDKYELINKGICRIDQVDPKWFKKDNHNHEYLYDCVINKREHIDKVKMRYWLNHLKYPIYHLDFETFPCPLPRFGGEKPYTQSVFEFSLHLERSPGVCDKKKDNFIFLNKECYDDERIDLVEDLIKHFQFNEDGTLRGTMLAQNTSFEIGRLRELAKIFPKYRNQLLAICNKSADLIHLLKTKEDFYSPAFGEDRAKTINYCHERLSGSYSIKKTLPVLVPTLKYSDKDVGNGVQAYITYLNYDSPQPTTFNKNNVMTTKDDRRKALKGYCRQDTWAMVEILREIRKKII